MNEKGHVLNAFLLSLGLGFVFHPAGDAETFRAIGEVVLPIVLGALFPDVDTSFGDHRKTFHNVFVLAIFSLFPLYFDNLHWVWLGILTHYVLDFAGTKRGLAFLYPLTRREFDFPLGVGVDSRHADAVMLLVTAGELAIAAVFVHVVPGLVESLLSGLPFAPGVSDVVQMFAGQ